jgi:hypothetical protein
MTMASDNKEAKTGTAAKTKTETKTAPKNDAAAKAESPAADAASKPASGEPADAAPANYSRGEAQKPVTAADKENWNAIFAKKTKKEKTR